MIPQDEPLHENIPTPEPVPETVPTTAEVQPMPEPEPVSVPDPTPVPTPPQTVTNPQPGNVCRTLHSKEMGMFDLGATKTNKGTRTIILPQSIVELLRQKKKRVVSQWIFPNPLHPEMPASPDSAYHHLKILLKRAGLPDIRFHDLSHTFAAHALTSGVDAKTLSGILGHTNTSFTLDTYTHVTSDMQKTASGIVGSFMEGLFGKEATPNAAIMRVFLGTLSN